MNQRPDILSLALSMLLAATPFVWSVPPVVLWGLIIFAIFLVGFAFGNIFKKPTEVPLKLVDKSEIKLHIYGDNRPPTLISENNVWRWYQLRNFRVTVDASTQTHTHTEESSILYLNFDAPVKAGTLEVSSPNIVLPHYEVKEFNNRFAIITFQQKLTPGTLVINVF